MQKDRPRTWVQKNYTSFNGLRGLAVFMVFVNHYGHLVMPPHWAMMLWPGVDLFFVLSGFLITGILYDSRSDPDYFKNFYVRRSLRIFPLYYGFFLVIFLLRHPLHMVYQPVMWSNALYVSNLTRLHPDVSNPTVIRFLHHGSWEIGMGAFWSLCVEEQFYLAWPLVVRLTGSRKHIMRFCEVAVFATLGLRTILYWRNPSAVALTHYLYFWTPTRCDGLFIGAWLAAWLRGVKITRASLQTSAYALIGISALIIVAGALTLGRRWQFSEVNPLLCTYGYTLVDLAAAGILLLSLDDSTLLSRVLRMKYLAALGTVSYGFYLFHGLYAVDLFELAGRFTSYPFGAPAVFVGGFALSWGLAWLSFRYYESPWLRLKSRLAPPRGHRERPQPVR